MFEKPLIAHFFTTVDFKIALRSFWVIVNPYFWFNMVDWKYIKASEKKLLNYLWLEQSSKAIWFYNARSAIYNCLKMTQIEKDDEIIIQSYTCVSVPNAIIQAWWKPVYIDIDETLNMDYAKIKKNITEKTKAIIIQHTFWNPANIEKIKKICEKNNIILIEDCAHSLWSQYEEQKVWTFWDFSIFSTWRDKVISTVTWWFLVINNKDYFDKVFEVRYSLDDISYKLAYKNILYNIIAFKSLFLYNIFKIWRVIMYLARKYEIIPEILTKAEKSYRYRDFNHKIPNCLAYLWISEIEKIDEYTKHRTKICKIYEKEFWKNYLELPKKEERENFKIDWIVIINTLENTINNWFWFPILTQNPEELLLHCKKNGVLLWNYWNWDAIIPVWVDQEKGWYIPWKCKNTELICKKILTLPTHININENDAKKIAQIIKSF
jgi:dTDP-4-amino-4,6-dideoxygalactose transaminase